MTPPQEEVALELPDELLGQRAPGGAPLARARRARNRYLTSKRQRHPEEIQRKVWTQVVGFEPNWISSATATNPTVNPIVTYTAECVVPQPPQSTGDQIVFVFIGLQDGPGTMILQPVLQWNLNGAFADRWTVSSWFVRQGLDPVYSQPVPVNPGDVLRPALRLTRHQLGEHTYECGFADLPATVKEAAHLPELKQAVCVLEAYRIENCSEYPDTSPITFRNVAIATAAGAASPKWTEQNWVIDCGQRCSAGANRIDLYCR